MPKPYSTLLKTTVEQRIAAWEKLQYEIAQAPRIRPTVTISRAFGCEAFPVSERLKASFEEASREPWTIFDHAIIEKVAQEQGVPVGVLKRLGELSYACEALGVQPVSHVVHDRAFARAADYIVQVARVGNAIVVGRGGSILCAGMKNCFHFRLEASRAWRVESVMRRLDASRSEAEHMVDTSSRLRDRFIKQTLHEDVAELKHYDAVFNNEHHSVDEIAAAIVAYVRCAWPDPSYFG